MNPILQQDLKDIESILEKVKQQENCPEVGMKDILIEDKTYIWKCYKDVEL